MLQLGVFDPEEVQQADAPLWQAHRAHQQAKRRLAELPQQLDAAQGAVTIATQQVFLAREHPDLIAELAAVQAQEPEDSDEPGASYRAQSVWRQRVASARAACDAAVQAAGL